MVFGQLVSRELAFYHSLCYWFTCSSRLELSLRRAKRHNVKYGVKLVRGAYLVQESALAADKGYPNPIWPNIEATHANYNACVKILLDNLSRAEVHAANTVGRLMWLLVAQGVSKDCLVFTAVTT